VKILVIDVDGSRVKIKATGQLSSRSTPSGKGMTAADMVEAVRASVRHTAVRFRMLKKG
jgi:hypothetical protein